MASLFYTVFEGAAEVALGEVLQEGAVTIGAGSLTSAAITGSGRKRRRVRIMCDSNAFVTWGESPTALNDGTEGRPMSAEVAEYFDIESGFQIAVIERV